MTVGSTMRASNALTPTTCDSSALAAAIAPSRPKPSPPARTTLLSFRNSRTTAPCDAPSAIRIVCNTSGVEISVGAAKVALTPASVSINDGALEVI